MSVHIDELHSDVAVAPNMVHAEAVDASDVAWQREQRWVDACERARWLAERVRAVGFDD